METAQELNLDDEKLDLAICRLNFATRSLIWWQQMKLEVQLPSNCWNREVYTIKCYIVPMAHLITVPLNN